MGKLDELARQFLAESDQDIAAATERIARARARVAELEREKRDASAERELLETFEGTLELMHRHRGVIAQLLELDKMQKGD